MNSPIRVKTLLVSVVAAAALVALVSMGWLLNAKDDDLDRRNADAANNAHAEQIALGYAVPAAEMSYQDLDSWRAKLTEGTSPELSNRLTQAANSMEQIVTPLQWVSSASPVAAKVMSVSDGVYSVDCFINVMTKNAQAPDGIQSTATYRLTIDSEHDWLITDVGGIDSALPTK